MPRTVTVTQDGRSGEVTYAEHGRRLAFWWEFGGGDTIALVNVGREDEWRSQHGWAVGRRAEILEFVAAELVRQKAPGCRAEIDAEGGWIRLKGASTPGAVAPRPSPATVASPGSPRPASGTARREFSHAAWRALRERLAQVVLVATAIVGGALWLKQEFLVIDPGKGAPLGATVRTPTHLATFIQTLVPYTPSLNRDHGRDRYRLSLFIVPLDGSATRLVDLPPDLPASAFGLAKILGGDGRTLWYDVAGVGAVDLASYRRLDAAQLSEPRLPRPRSPFAPALDSYLAAGFRVAPSAWFGLHAVEEAGGEFAPGRWLRGVESARDARRPRRLHRGVLEPAAGGGPWRIVSMTALDGHAYPNGAFLRTDADAEPLRLRDPDGALVVFSSDAGPKATLAVARVDFEGRSPWRADTGIDRFTLRQILPGATSTAFVGTRPPVPGKVSEPLLVLVEHATGRVVTHSLWR